MATLPNTSQSNGRQLQSATLFSTHPDALKSRNRREYIREYQRGWIARRRQEWIDANGPCAKCGSSKNLEVDHINPEDKQLNPRALWSMSPHNPQRIAELAKCQVLCEDCHKKKTASHNSALAIARSYKNSTGYRGVTLERCGLFRARAKHKGIRFTIGWYETAKKAGQAVVDFLRASDEEKLLMLGSAA